MKILYYVGAAHNFTGSQRSLATLAAALPSEIQRQALFPANGRAVKGFQELGIPTRVIQAPDALNTFDKKLLHLPKAAQGGIFISQLVPYTVRLWRYLRREQADIVHCNDARAVLLAGWAAKANRMPVVWHLRGRNILVQHPLLNKLAHSLSDVVITVAAALQGDVAPGKPCYTVYNGVATDLPTSAANIRQYINEMLCTHELNPDETLILMTASSLIPFKGLHHLLEALHQVIQYRPQLANALAWIILGEADTSTAAKYRAYLVDRSKALALDRNLIWVGWQENAPGWIGCADIIALPTAEEEVFRYPDGEQMELICTEGLPRTVLEAMAAGKPVVASNVAGTGELVENGQTGFLVRAGDPNSLADALLQLVDSQQRRTAMGLMARQRVQESFSVERMVCDTLQLYKRIRSQ